MAALYSIIKYMHQGCPLIYNFYALSSSLHRNPSVTQGKLHTFHVNLGLPSIRAPLASHPASHTVLIQSLQVSKPSLLSTLAAIIFLLKLFHRELSLSGRIDKAVALYTESFGFDSRHRLHRFVLCKLGSGGKGQSVGSTIVRSWLWSIAT